MHFCTPKFLNSKVGQIAYQINRQNYNEIVFVIYGNILMILSIVCILSSRSIIEHDLTTYRQRQADKISKIFTAVDKEQGVVAPCLRREVYLNK